MRERTEYHTLALAIIWMVLGIWQCFFVFVIPDIALKVQLGWICVVALINSLINFRSQFDAWNILPSELACRLCPSDCDEERDRSANGGVGE
jgi:hypothetical protein